MNDITWEERRSRPRNSLQAMVGQRFGQLTVTAINRSSRRSICLCLCACGASKSVEAGKLRTGHTKSCGCGRARHGHARDTGRSPEYTAWSAMCRRCHSPTDKRFPGYGGRGTRVCDEWRGPCGFDRFIAHVGPRPSSKHSIDRIDNAGHYEPGNVRWATQSEQQRNKRVNRWIDFAGRRQILSDWAREFGLAANVLNQRIRLGWSMEKALSTPVKLLARRRAA